MPSHIQPEPKVQLEPKVKPEAKAQLQRNMRFESQHRLKPERVGQRRGHRPRMRACLIVFLSALALASVAHADTLTLANGDRLTGKIVKSDGKELTFETDYTGSATM